VHSSGHSPTEGVLAVCGAWLTCGLIPQVQHGAISVLLDTMTTHADQAELMTRTIKTIDNIISADEVRDDTSRDTIDACHSRRERRINLDADPGCIKFWVQTLSAIWLGMSVSSCDCPARRSTR
jgi:hypothetical protein